MDGKASVLVSENTITLTEGETATIRAFCVPGDKKATFASSDDAVATVTASKGKITAVSAGTAVITATLTVGEDTVEDVCVVTVEAAAPEVPETPTPDPGQE